MKNIEIINTNYKTDLKTLTKGESNKTQLNIKRVFGFITNPKNKFMSTGLIANHFGFSIRRALRIINKLKKLGLVSITQKSKANSKFETYWEVSHKPIKDFTIIGNIKGNNFIPIERKDSGLDEYYVYLHRLKNNTVFYVGCAKSKNRIKDYTHRNKLWKAVSKWEFTYEIVKDNLSQTEAYVLETQLINEYGRLVIGTGTLTNIVCGGKLTQYSKSYKELTERANILAKVFENSKINSIFVL